jgi:hypothetical protein
MKQDLIKKNHGCSDAKAGGHPYINSPSKGSAFHTANFMQGYNDGPNFLIRLAGKIQQFFVLVCFSIND